MASFQMIKVINRTRGPCLVQYLEPAGIFTWKKNRILSKKTLFRKVTHWLTGEKN